MRRVAVLATLACALALPAAATADDQSVYNSFHFSHPRFKKLRRDFEHGERHWENSGYQDPSEANRACRRTVDLSHKVVDKMQAKHTSTDLGRSAKHDAVNGLKYRRRWADAERLAIESFMNFGGAGYIRRHRKAKDYIKKAQRYEARAQKSFKEAGVNTAP